MHCSSPALGKHGPSLKSPPPPPRTCRDWGPEIPYLPHMLLGVLHRNVVVQWLALCGEAGGRGAAAIGPSRRQPIV